MTIALGTFFAMFPVVLAVVGLRPVTDRELVRFSVRYYLLDEAITPTLARAIARARGFRLLGAALGFSLPPLVRGLSGDSVDVGSALFWGAAGYLGGALVATLIPTTRANGDVRAATLVPRRTSDYLPRRTIVAPGVALCLTLVAAVAYQITPRWPYRPQGAGPVIGAVVLSVIASVVTSVGTRLVVRRRQPVPDTQTVAADDALRSHGLHLVVGTGIAVSALAAGLLTLQVAFVTSSPVLHWICVCAGLAEVGFAGFAWGHLRKDPWRVRSRVRS
ncbi:MAG TPA: hypothetical protein VHS52_04025 [Acidimicrobiales bacterium]|nr:hypothetical protein [Acidimicrobiales bacterium]